MRIRVAKGTFNRTIVELKLRSKTFILISFITFNRTIVELKSDRMAFGSFLQNSFNRTIVELKCELAAASTIQELLLIVLS